MSVDVLPAGPGAPTTPVPLPAPASTPIPRGFEQRIAREHLRLAQRQIVRIPLPYALIDGFLCWMLVRLGLAVPAFAWLAVLVTLQTARWLYARRLDVTSVAHPERALRRLAGVLLLLGLLRGAEVPVLFSRPVQSEHYLFTMIYVGMLAGTSASVGGLVKPFAGYAVMACGSLALGWLLRGDTDGIWLGTLIAMLIGVLIAHVRDQGDGLRQFVRLACDNEDLAESLRVARDQSELASQSKTRFFAAASHDLRQPLHALSINATTLEILARRQSDPMIRELSQGINRALNQSNGLLDSLLEISNLDADAVKPELRSVDLGELLTGVRDEFAALAAKKGLKLLLDLQDAPAFARSDPGLLRRILNNLVGNAIKFSESGSVTLATLNRTAGADDAGAGADADADQVRVAVSDTGPGIAPAEQQRVFEEFYQIGNTSRDRGKGLGLGLSIVKRMAVLLGAGVDLQSTPGVGTCIELRLERAAPDEAAAADGRLPAAAELEVPVGLRILVVDDEPEILASLKGLLTQWGCSVRCAADGAAAFDAVRGDFVPHVLLVDHRLRSESGVTVIERIRERHGAVPAVLVTGDTAPATIQAARAAGHRVIFKPVQGDVLATALCEAARSAGPARR